MFKRLERRQKRKQQEEELGLDEETRDIMGLQDTDSSESETSSDSDSDVSNTVSDRALPSRGLAKGLRDGGPDHGSDTNGQESADGGQDEASEVDSKVDHEMTIADALRNPLYALPSGSDHQTCIVCPGKLLKNQTMIDIHMRSSVCSFTLSFEVNV